MSGPWHLRVACALGWHHYAWTRTGSTLAGVLGLPEGNPDDPHEDPLALAAIWQRACTRCGRPA